jgi:hypothetical protein
MMMIRPRFPFGIEVCGVVSVQKIDEVEGDAVHAANDRSAIHHKPHRIGRERVASSQHPKM